MYASMPDTITSVMRSAQRWVSDTETVTLALSVSVQFPLKAAWVPWPVSLLATQPGHHVVPLQPQHSIPDTQPQATPEERHKAFNDSFSMREGQSRAIKYRQNELYFSS
ncbi:hypothetical protein E2C01_036655 [Portunus trituberculatus]|uniref:Uncharacterized protein n=1 Tax=Portunus trituberculatus TaxID=210409 RepID=A0A5B7F632_PORTR|nr:hypothetical protein [Portunus trituberculatus]